MFIYAEPRILTKVQLSRKLHLILVKSTAFHVVQWKSTNILEKHITSIFGVNK
jgi:hypothetical protein